MPPTIIWEQKSRPHQKGILVFVLRRLLKCVGNCNEKMQQFRVFKIIILQLLCCGSYDCIKSKK